MKQKGFNMNCLIMLYDMIDGGWFYSDCSNMNINRLGYNMSHKWAWNNIDLQRENNDGECCYIQYV